MYLKYLIPDTYAPVICAGGVGMFIHPESNVNIEMDEITSFGLIFMVFILLKLTFII